MRISPREYVRLILAGLGATAVASTIACDVPTSPPRWNTTWHVPADSSEIAISSLLPASVTVVDMAGTPAFAMDVSGTSFSRSLGEACNACVLANGTRVPKPEFTIAGSSTVALPTDVASADLVGGFIDYSLGHSFDFDPLRPSSDAGAAKGWFTATISRGSTVIARDSVNGAELAFPPGTTHARVVTLGASHAAPLRIDGPLTVAVTLYSPSGDEITMNSSHSVTVHATPRELRVGEARVSVPSRTLVARESTMDLSGLGQEVSARVQSGAVILRILNPFAVQGIMSATLTAPGGTPIVKQVALPLGGASATPVTLRVDLTSTELSALLGHTNVAVAVNGNVDAPSGQVTVAPTQAFVVRSMLEVILATGGN